MLDKGDFQEAEQVLRDALKVKLTYPNYSSIFTWTPEKFLLKLFYLSKNVEAGLTFLSEYEYSDYVEFGYYFEVDGNIDSAVFIYEKALQINPDNAEAFKRICIMYEREERYDEAIKYCQVAIKRGLSDMTKGGFEGRMKRIIKKRKRCLQKK